MDAVEAFKDELQSLLESKPPVTKAKMISITRAAMKSVKFYKHIVMSVEKFIAKSRPEYKVPGLYVIDSIVRQSRHQFGIERDVYVARFSRNLSVTFNNLFTGCLHDDKPKIVRVLNLWQKNGVFNSQVIQPLLDLAAKNPNSLPPNSESNLSAESPAANQLSSDPNTSKQQTQSTTSKYLAQHQFGSQGCPTNYSKNSTSDPNSSKHRSDRNSLSFSKNMLDFDYDEDDDDGDETPTEAEPPLSSTLNKIEMEQRIRNDVQPSSSNSQSSHQKNFHHPPIEKSSTLRNDQDPVLERWNRLFKQQSITDECSSNEYSASETKFKIARNKSRSRSRSRSKSPHSVSKSRDKFNSRDIQSHLERPPSPPSGPEKPSGQLEKERKAERIRKCLPEIRDGHLTVCSSTLWLGHVPKNVSEPDISDAFGEFGTITSIDLIPPRGCAYVCMDRRQDAKKALGESRNLKLNGSHIKMAWAPGKGFKEYKRLKDFWEVDIGCSYIPYSKIDSSIDFDILEEGGVIDEESMSMGMREMRETMTKEKENKSKIISTPASTTPILPGLTLPALPMLSQPPPFSLPNLSIPPPPTSMSQGIPFPPPGIIPPNHQSCLAPPPNLLPFVGMHSATSLQQGPQNSTGTSANLTNHLQQDDQDSDSMSKSPAGIDQQLSMTERQINLVEQQLNLLQQAQGMTPTSMPAPMLPQNIFHQQHPNPMMFDMPPPAQMLGGAQLLEQQISAFASSTLLNQTPSMLPINRANLNPNINSHSMPPYGDGY